MDSKPADAISLEEFGDRCEDLIRRYMLQLDDARMALMEEMRTTLRRFLGHDLHDDAVLVKERRHE